VIGIRVFRWAAHGGIRDGDDQLLVTASKTCVVIARRTSHTARRTPRASCGRGWVGRSRAGVAAG